MSENHVGPSGSNTLAFLELPQRVTKPRQKGLTIVRDYGLGSFAARDLMESVGEYIDFLKFRNVLSALEGDDLVRNKIQIYRAAGVEVFTGGILFEVAVMRGKVDRLWPAISSLGFTAAEVSDNMVDISLKEKREHVRQAAAAGLKVIFEYGKKFPDAPLDLEEAADEIQSILEDGAYKVVLERSELDLLLGANADRPEIERLLQLVERVGVDNLVFEAETTPHMVWCVRTFGPDVNLGPNIEPEKVARIEPLRRGLAREIGYEFFEKAGG